VHKTIDVFATAQLTLRSNADSHVVIAQRVFASQ